jgi:ABC-type glycerol-3-phosphate transport system substrate-binding protein
MKTLRNLVIALCAVCMFAACGGSTPEAVAENFQQAMMDGDFKEAAKYATKSTAPMLEQAASMLSEEQLKKMKEETKGVKISVKSSEVKENEAAVTLETVAADGEADEMVLQLIKEDGSWKVVFKK